MKNVFIFGATGSIGQQAIDVIKESQNLNLIGISYFNNESLAIKIKNDFELNYVYCHKNNNDDWKDLIKKSKPDIVLNSITGSSGIGVTKFCLENNIKIALANKESIVMAGMLIDYKQNLIFPVDSEHSSLYELMQNDYDSISEIYITASGGPFYNLDKKEVYTKKFEDAIKHPNWSMGYKISIDSATLINKCFELIETYYFFKNKNIKPLYHPSSIVHALVKYKNNSVISYMSSLSMKLPIALALNEFKNKNYKVDNLDFNNLILKFEEIDINKYKPIQWAYDLIKNDLYSIGIIVCVLDDYLINEFKDNNIYFGQITDIIDVYVQKYKNYKINEWNNIFELKEILLKEIKIDLKERKYNEKVK